ncbi:MAG: helix-turn-helix domain-containing protein [Sulfurimonas sp.]|jgi:predicted DNA-binding transcriptional regulator AlpA
MENQYLREKEASKYLCVAVSTIWQYSKQGKITPIRLSPRVTVWAKADLDAFVASRSTTI